MDYLKLVGAAFAGAAISVFADIIQKADAEASAVLVMANKVKQVFGFPVAPVAMALLIVLLSVVVCFIYGVTKPKEAFIGGASVLSMMMTATPVAKIPSAPITPTQNKSIPADNSFLGIFSPKEAYAQTDEKSKDLVPVDVTIKPQGAGATSNTTVTIKKDDSTISQSVIDRNQFTLNLPQGQYKVKVATPGYAITEEKLIVPSKGSNDSRELTINLQPSSVPLSIQRAFRAE
jgi:hypothetical protein